MAQKNINYGSAPNDGTGDPIRVSFNNCDDNFDELYASNLKKENSSVAGTLANDLGGTGNIINGNECFAIGMQNGVIPIDNRGKIALYAQAFGYQNNVYTEAGLAIGKGCLTDGELGVAFGNASIASGNDSVALGGHAITGRRLYFPIGHGLDDPGLCIGNKAYILIDPTEGNVSLHFPVTNVYIDPPTNTLKWAQHPYLILTDSESKGLFFLILKTEYTIGFGTKVWYDSASDVGNGKFVCASYSPALPVGEEGGNSMTAEGKFTNSCGYGAHSEGVFTKAWGYGAHAEGRSSIARATAAHAEGWSIAKGDYSHAQGLDAIASRAGQSSIGCSNGKFITVGDAQVSTIVTKKSGVGAGWHQLNLFVPEFGKTYVAETLLAGKQFSSTNGMIGESCAYKYKWYVDKGEKHDFNPTDVDIDDDTIIVAEKIKSGTKLLFSTTGTLPTGINYYTVYYAIYVNDTLIEVEASIGGGKINLSSQGSGVHSYCRFNFKSLTKELIGRSFVDDGDTVGDGLTTGIRADIHQTFFGEGIVIRIDSIATRSIRWVASTNFVEVM